MSDGMTAWIALSAGSLIATAISGFDGEAVYSAFDRIIHMGVAIWAAGWLRGALGDRIDGE